MTSERTITILGSTGSIGTQTLSVLDTLPYYFHLNFLTTNTNITLLEEQALRYHPVGVAICNEEAYHTFKKNTAFKGIILCGMEGVCQAASDIRNTLLMSALVGFSGVLPTLEAIKNGITIALANKETLVSAGHVIMNLARLHGSSVIAVDSEHSAILQCLAGEHPRTIEKLILTASGGPFRDISAEKLASVTVQEALRHPNWVMGHKITIDSATLMNKGFEVIEARWLFDIPADRIEVVIHPESIIHSMVQFIDGSVKAQLGVPDMKIPILYALTYPERLPSSFERLDLASIGSLSFMAPDVQRFPCLRLAFDALKTGGTATAILNAANEIAVAGFLQERMRFQGIAEAITYALDKIPSVPHPSIGEIIEADRETRAIISSYIGLASAP